MKNTYKYQFGQWHYTKNHRYPQVFDKYVTDPYPLIPCLVQYHDIYAVRYWNVTEEVWDNETKTAEFCKKDEVTRWKYLEPLIDN